MKSKPCGLSSWDKMSTDRVRWARLEQKSHTECRLTAPLLYYSFTATAIVKVTVNFVTRMCWDDASERMEEFRGDLGWRVKTKWHECRCCGKYLIKYQQSDSCSGYRLCLQLNDRVGNNFCKHKYICLYQIQQPGHGHWGFLLKYWVVADGLWLTLGEWRRSSYMTRDVSHAQKWSSTWGHSRKHREDSIRDTSYKHHHWFLPQTNWCVTRVSYLPSYSHMHDSLTLI